MSPTSHGDDEPRGLYVSGKVGIRWSVGVLALRSILLAVAAVIAGSLIDVVAAGDGGRERIPWLAMLLTAAVFLGWVWPRLAQHTAARVETSLQTRILQAVLRHPMGRYRTGEVTSRATEGVTAVGTLAGVFLPQLIGGVLIPILICAVVATIDVPSALVLAIAVPAVPLLLRGMEKRFTSVTTRYRETADALSARFFDGVQGMKTLKTLDASDRYGRHLADESESLRAETMTLLRVNQLALLAVDSLFTLGTVVAAAGVAMWRFGDGAITVGEAVALILLGVSLIEPISQIGRFFYVGAIGRAAARDIKAFLTRSEEGRHHVAPRGGQGWIELEEVGFSYEPGQPVLEGLTLEIGEGETVGLVGPSGSGKTTIAALISGLLTPDAGSVRVGGRVAVVAQQPFLFHGTIRENLSLADPEAGDDAMWAALETADLLSLVGDHALGLDLAVGERGLQISGGEAQRLAIARAVLVDAPIVILDEPTSNVDIETETRVRQALKRLTAGKTVVIIAHRRSTLADVERVISVLDGSITETVPS